MYLHVGLELILPERHLRFICSMEDTHICWEIITLPYSTTQGC